MTAERLAGIDSFRVLGVIAVIAIHVTNPHIHEAPPGLDVYVAVNQLARFAVPFFFLVSGYLWGRKIRAGADIRGASLALAKRALILFVVWSAVYALPYDFWAIAQYGPSGPIKVAYWNVAASAADPLAFILGGTKPHLWFLTALAICVVVAACFVRWGRDRWLLVIAALLYVVGVLGKSYLQTPIGLDMGVDTRNGPFFGLLLFATGHALSALKPDASWLWKGALCLAAGIAGQFAELVFLHTRFGIAYEQDYVFATYFMGLGCGLIALSNPRWLTSRVASWLGPLTLGLYAIHFVFVDLLRPLDRWFTGIAWLPVSIATVFLLSSAVVLMLARSNRLRPFVS